MICPRCGDNNLEGAHFCKVCGESFDRGVNTPSQNAYQPYQAQVIPPIYPYPGYGAFPPARSVGDPKKNIFATLGLILGILTLPSCSLFYLIFQNPITAEIALMIAVLVAVTAFVCSIIGLNSTNKGVAIAGLVVSLIAIIVTGFFLIAVISLIQNPNEEVNQLLDMYRQYFDEVNS